MFFNPHAEVEVTERQLPHWNQKGVTYFVKFRLADSVPQSKLRLWKLKRDEFLEAHPPPLSKLDTLKFHRQFTNKIENYLDAGMGSCIFKNNPLSQLLANTLHHFDGIRYELRDWVIMPNHVHATVTPKPGYDLKKILHSWKSYSAKQINKHLGRIGKLWQDESFDQIVRNEEHCYRISEYIERNPQKAGIRVHHGSWL